MYSKRIEFLESDLAARIRSTLEQMVGDGTYNTESSYSSNTDTYPDHLIPFVDKHMNYLSTHPNTDPMQYLANLRLMTRAR